MTSCPDRRHRWRHQRLVSAGMLGRGWTVALAGRRSRDVRWRDWRPQRATRGRGEFQLCHSSIPHLDAAGRTPNFVLYNASARTRGPVLDLDPARSNNPCSHRLRGFPRGAGSRAQDGAYAAAAQSFYRRLGQRQRLCPVGTFCDGQIRGPWSCTESSARIAAQGHTRRPLCHRWRVSSRERPADSAKPDAMLDPDAIAAHVLGSIGSTALGVEHGG